MGMRKYSAIGLAAAFSVVAVGCARTNPGTHVELVDKGGEKVYVAGAAAPGMSKSTACKAAVGRAVAAIALKFAQEQDDVADDVADAVGTSDGEVFMQKFAKWDAQKAALQDLSFDPMEHLCMATVRWKAPIFVKDAVLKYAERLKNREMQESEGGAAVAPQGASSTSSAAPVAAAPAPRPSSPPPAATSVAPPAAEAGPVVPACRSTRKSMKAVRKKGQKRTDDLAECLRRTKNDETICHRYVLYVKEAQENEEAAGAKLAGCLNEGLSSDIKVALSKELPGHAAVSVETTASGARIIWGYSPAKHTGFALQISTDGTGAVRSPLAANQQQWLKEQLGL